MRTLNDAHGLRLEQVLAIKSLPQLKAFIGAEIAQWFPGARSAFRPNAQFPVETAAMATKRLIYLPQRNPDAIFVSGNTGKDAVTIYSATPGQIDLINFDFDPSAGCFIAAPLLSGAEEVEFKVHGLLLVAHPAPETFDPQVDLEIIRMIANDMGVAMLTNGLSF